MSGRYRDLVDIQQDSRTGDNPQPVYTGEPFVKDVPGDLTIVSGGETFRGRQLQPHIVAVFECHYLEGVVPTMRLNVTGGISTGKVLNIDSVRPVDYDGRTPKLMLDCKAVDE